VNILLISIPAILIISIYAILALAFYLIRKFRQMKGYRPPFTDKFFRSPGESLNRQIMEINDRLTENLALVITMPISFYAIYISSLHFGNSKFSTFTTTFYIIAGIGLIAYCLFNLVKSLWLGKAVGEAVRVRPVVALPGWYVERSSSNGIPVINPKKFRSIAKQKNGDILSGQMISRIVHQLEQKCRDVEPKSSGD
jgi:hypothetical protein